MVISSRDALRSLTNEAGRQADFFDRRGQLPVSQFWSELEALAFAAQRTGRHLHVDLRDTDGTLSSPALVTTPPPTWVCRFCDNTNGATATHCECGLARP